MFPVKYAPPPPICDASVRSLRTHELGTLKWAGRVCGFLPCRAPRDTPTETQNPGVKEEPLIPEGHL